MNHVCREIASFSRSSESLLSKEGTLTEDERSLLEYYINELSREYLSDNSMVRLRYNENAPVKPASALSYLRHG